MWWRLRDHWKHQPSNWSLAVLCNIEVVWAASWQNQQNDCAPSEDSDQPGHPPSLIRVFAVRMKKAWLLSYPLSAQRRCPGWSESSLGAQSFCWFCHEAARIGFLWANHERVYVSSVYSFCSLTHTSRSISCATAINIKFSELFSPKRVYVKYKNAILSQISCSFRTWND